MNYDRILLICLLSVLSLTCYAQDFQSISSIKQSAEQFLTAELLREKLDDVKVTAGSLDARLKLVACQTPLRAFIPHQGSAQRTSTVGVRCEGAQPWTLYVPVKTQIFERVAISLRPLARGEAVSKDDFELTRRDVARINYSYYTDSQKVAGTVVRRPLRAGRIITRGDVRPRKLVHRGKTVRITANSVGIVVAVKGVALDNASLGETVRVRNTSSKRIIEATVSGVDKVKVS